MSVCKAKNPNTCWKHGVPEEFKTLCEEYRNNGVEPRPVFEKAVVTLNKEDIPVSEIIGGWVEDGRLTVFFPRESVKDGLPTADDSITILGDTKQSYVEEIDATYAQTRSLVKRARLKAIRERITNTLRFNDSSLQMSRKYSAAYNSLPSNFGLGASEVVYLVKLGEKVDSLKTYTESEKAIVLAQSFNKLGFRLEKPGTDEWQKDVLTLWRAYKHSK